MPRRTRTGYVLSSAARIESLERRMLLSLSPADNEFRLNAVTGNVRENVAIAVDADGDFVAVWESSGQDGSIDGIFARRFNASGVPQGAEFQVNTYTTGNQTTPAVAMDADGDFVIAWTSNLQDGSLEGIFAQRYSATGVSQGGEFRVNTFTTNVQASPSVAMDTAGNFMIAWYSVNQESASNVGIYAQRYDFNGVRLGGEFLVNSSTPSPQYTPSVAMDLDGDFVIAWDSGGQDGSSYGVYARRFGRAGLGQGGEFRVNTFTTGLQSGATVAMSGGGDFVIGWHSQGQDGSSQGVYAQRYNASGTPQGGEFRVNTHTTGAQLLPKVAMDADGDFLITWNSSAQDGSGYGVFAQHYDKAGVPLGGEFRVNTTTSSEQLAPRVAATYKGDFVIAWHGNGADDPQGIYAQRYVESVDAAPPIFGGAFIGGQRVLPYTTHHAPLSQIVVSFSENMSDAGGPAGPNSVTNPANWLITRNGADITSGLSITYGFNPATNRFEALLNLSPSFTSGNFLLKARDNIRDVAGNRLDGNLDGVAGGTSLLPFSIGSIELQAGNTFVTNTPGSPAVAADAARNFVITWTSSGQDGDGAGAYARRYNSGGVAQGGEFLVNTTTAGSQFNPAVAMDADGDFVIAWSGNGLGDGYGIFAQRYNAAGVAQGGEFLVNAFTTNFQKDASIAMDADGDFVISWWGYGPGDGSGIFAQRFNAAGIAQGGEFRVNSFTTQQQAVPSIAMDRDGDFVVAWQSLFQDGSDTGVYAQRYNSAGIPQGSEFRVNLFTTNAQSSASVAMDADGDFVVAWESYGEGVTGQDGDGGGIFAQRYNAAGLRQGDEFRVNSFTADDQFTPSVAMDADGDFVVAWESYGQDGDRFGVYAQRYNAAGIPVESEFPVNSFTTENQLSPSVAMDADGEFVVAWRSAGLGIFFQRYGLRRTPPVGTLADAPDPVTGGSAITLSAGDVVSNDGTVVSVAFYRETNGDPGLQVGVEGDTLVGSTSTNVGGFWSINVPTAGLGNGTYTYWAQATDDAGLIGTPASTTNSVINAPPAVNASSFLFNTSPHRLSFTFNDNVSASLGTDDIVLENLTTMLTIPSAQLSLSYDLGTNTATFSYTGNASGIVGVLPDGNYRATLIAAGITNSGGTPLAANHLFNLFFLNGDANHDGRVSLPDFNILAGNFGSTNANFSQADFNYSGTVTLADFNILAGRFGAALGPQADEMPAPQVSFNQQQIDPDSDALSELLD